eukprot:11025240-Lingulodinium_polyedra.AAC.1
MQLQQQRQQHQQQQAHLRELVCEGGKVRLLRGVFGLFGREQAAPQTKGSLVPRPPERFRAND